MVGVQYDGQCAILSSTIKNKHVKNYWLSEISKTMHSTIGNQHQLSILPADLNNNKLHFYISLINFKKGIKLMIVFDMFVFDQMLFDGVVYGLSYGILPVVGSKQLTKNYSSITWKIPI